MKNEAIIDKGPFNNVIRTMEELGGFKEGLSIDDSDLINNLKIKRDNLREKMNKFEKLCLKNDVKKGAYYGLERDDPDSITSLKLYDEIELMNLITKLEDNSKNLETDLARNQLHIERVEKDLKMKGKEEHRYENKKEELNRLFEKLESFENVFEQELNYFWIATSFQRKLRLKNRKTIIWQSLNILQLK